MLSIAGNPNVTDYDVEDLCAACCRLVELILRTCVRLTDASLSKIGKLAATQKSKGLPSLRWLDIGGCNRITDKGLRAIAVATELEVLDLRGLNKVSLFGLTGALQQLPQLKEVNITACTGDPDEAASTLSAQVTSGCSIKR